jgi:hypothetical protein
VGDREREDDCEHEDDRDRERDRVGVGERDTDGAGETVADRGMQVWGNPAIATPSVAHCVVKNGEPLAEYSRVSK